MNAFVTWAGLVWKYEEGDAEPEGAPASGQGAALLRPRRAGARERPGRPGSSLVVRAADQCAVAVGGAGPPPAEPGVAGPARRLQLLTLLDERVRGECPAYGP